MAAKENVTLGKLRYMKALIFNSGLGSRLGRLTEKRPKAMVRLNNGETVFSRQLRILFDVGIRDFVITTGPYAEQLICEAAPYVSRGCTISFVPNEIYDQTNYIYSMFRARELLLTDDFLMLHGDLVFDADYAQKVVESEVESLGSVNRSLELPKKDFKARLVNGRVHEVSVGIFDENCVAFQPFYKLSRRSMDIWLANVTQFCKAGHVKVYAENAANEVFHKMNVSAFSYTDHLVEEIDTPEDLSRVSAAIRLIDFEQQPVFHAGESFKLISGRPIGSLRYAASLNDVLDCLEIKNPLVVSSHDPEEGVGSLSTNLASDHLRFDVGSDALLYEEILEGVRKYQMHRCDGIVSIGGKTAIDAAKCIKIFAAMPEGAEERYAQGDFSYSPIKHVSLSRNDTEAAHSCRASCIVENDKVHVEHDCLQPTVSIISQL